jgi:hypothetical protein
LTTTATAVAGSATDITSTSTTSGGGLAAATSTSSTAYCNVNHVTVVDKKTYLGKAAAATCTANSRIIAATTATAAVQLYHNWNIWA